MFVPIYADLIDEGGEKTFFVWWKKDGERRVGSQHVIRVKKIDVEKQNVLLEFDGGSYLLGYNVDQEEPGLDIGVLAYVRHFLGLKEYLWSVERGLSP